MLESLIPAEVGAFVLREDNSPFVDIFGTARDFAFAPTGGGGGKAGVEPKFGDADTDDVCNASLFLDCGGYKSGDKVVAVLRGVPF